MPAIRIETTIDEATATALPALRPLLGKRVELIALQAEGESAQAPETKLTLDDFLAARLVPGPGAETLSLEDIEKAIERGATGAITSDVASA